MDRSYLERLAGQTEDLKGAGLFKPERVLASPQQRSDDTPSPPLLLQAGRPCPECGNASMIARDGCDFCTACGYVGQCG